MNAIKDFKNELLGRREVKLVFEHSGNPGSIKASEMVAEHFKAKAENVALKNIKGKFGRDTFLIDAFIYDSLDIKNKIEPKVKVKKAAGAA